VDLAPQVLHRQYAHLVRAQRVGDRALGLLGRPSDPFALPQRVSGIGGEFGFDADHKRVRTGVGDRRGDARDQTAAADRADHEVDIRAVGGDLESDRPLARDHVPIVERRDRRIAVRRDQLVDRRRAGRQTGLAEHDPRPARPGRRDLDRGRVGGNDDRRRHAVQRRGICHGMGMIAARVGDHALVSLGGRQGADGRVSAT